MALQHTNLIYGENFYPHYYLCRYLPLSTGSDSMSLSLLKFKRGRQPDLKSWIDQSLEIFPSLLIPPDSIILRALHHDETSIREAASTSLDKLCKTLAAHFHSHYCPRALRKSHPTPEIKELSKEQRAAELKNSYYIDLRFLPASCQLSNQIPPANPSPTFLLIDDILTTGTTMQMIISAILAFFPKAQIVIFTLAKADYDN